MYEITFKRSGIKTTAEEGETLLSVMQKAGLQPDAPCGGHGACGKCKVTLENGETVLACQTKAEADMVVDEEDAKAPGDVQILTTSSLPDADVEIRMPDEKESAEENTADNPETDAPFTVELLVNVRPCPAGESISDWTRFEEGIQNACKAAGIPVGEIGIDPDIASRVGRMARANGNQVYAVLCGDKVVDVFPEEKPCFAAAFDIGTTTVAAYLLDMGKDGKGKVVTTESSMNPQAQYGADVINRANYALEHGMEDVSACIRKTVGEMIGSMAEKAGITPDDIYAVSIAGNTCMHHLFLGVDVDSLVHAPYNPALSDPVILRAADYGIPIHKKGRMLMLPNIAGFVGADTVACLVATKLAEQKDWTLLIDIGTNGEMVLGRDHTMAACSTAAGPAFEGAGISCGMRGSAGAISKVVWKDGKWEIETIGAAAPRGICGSGLLDLAAQLLISGQMDETGEIENAPVVLADETRGEDGKAVTILQKDIRQLQLAKAAIASGVYLLAEKLGIKVGDIKTVWLAGAFGSFLSPESACRIGLIPQELDGRIRAVGNAAGEGAKMVLQSRAMWRYAKHVARESEFLELASMPEFQDRYVDELMFPE